jgi:hypothetical protein
MKRSPAPRRKKALARSRAPLPRRTGRIMTRYRTKGGRHSDPRKLAWIHNLACWAHQRDRFACGGPVQAHHVRIYGSRATDKLVLPLCLHHHAPDFPNSIEAMGRTAFEAYHGSTLEAAEQYERIWQLRKQSTTKGKVRLSETPGHQSDGQHGVSSQSRPDVPLPNRLPGVAVTPEGCDSVTNAGGAQPEAAW